MRGYSRVLSGTSPSFHVIKDWNRTLLPDDSTWISSESCNIVALFFLAEISYTQSCSCPLISVLSHEKCWLVGRLGNGTKNFRDPISGIFSRTPCLLYLARAPHLLGTSETVYKGSFLLRAAEAHVASPRTMGSALNRTAHLIVLWDRRLKRGTVRVPGPLKG